MKKTHAFPLALGAALIVFSAPAKARIHHCCAQHYGYVSPLPPAAYGHGNIINEPNRFGPVPNSIWYYEHYGHYSSNCDTPSGAC